MAEREKIISLIILSLLSFVFSFCVSLCRTVFSAKMLAGRRGTRHCPQWNRQSSGAEQILHIFLSIWAVLLWLPDTKLGLCFWLKLRSTILQGPIFPIENLLIMISFWEAQRSDKISWASGSQSYLFENMQNSILPCFIVLSVIKLRASSVIVHKVSHSKVFCFSAWQ